MGCGASSSSQRVEEGAKEEEMSPERKALLEQMAEVERKKEEKEKQRQKEEDEERVRQNALEDARLAYVVVDNKNKNNRGSCTCNLLLQLEDSICSKIFTTKININEY